MATAVTPVSQQIAWSVMDDTELFLDDTGDLSDPKSYNHTDTASNWQSRFSPNSDQRVRIDLATEANSLLLKFYGHPFSALSVATPGFVYVGEGAVWGVSELVKQTTTEYVGDYLGRFELIVGNDTVTSSNILSTDPDTAWVREIAVTEDRSIFPAMRIVGQQGDAAPVLVFDSMGYSQVIIELRCKLPAGFQSPGLTPGAAGGLGFLWRVL